MRRRSDTISRLLLRLRCGDVTGGRGVGGELVSVRMGGFGWRSRASRCLRLHIALGVVAAST